ncbi:MAG: GntR family transcriptional regulator [Actinomycetota bacterium]
MVAPQTPKYQAIYGVLRGRILDGVLAPGEQLPPQHELAASFGVTLMTLRQAIAALEGDGLVRAERGRGTFVADRPVDIAVGNLSSFAEQMRSAGVDLVTEVLDVRSGGAARWPVAAAALGVDPGLDEGGSLLRIVRRRSVAGRPVALQRSYVGDGAVGGEEVDGLAAGSLYESIAARTGRIVTEARESITAVALTGDDAALLDAEPGHPALLSVRTSIDQFGAPVLYDEAWLVGGRSAITADRSSRRLALQYGPVGDDD